MRKIKAIEVNGWWTVLLVLTGSLLLVGVGAGCPASGMPGPYCGDGVVDLGESCDDGNEVGCDGCSITCHIEGCGNGITECGEECDDGNVVAGDGCAPDCTVEPGPECGDGAMEGAEECDDGNTDDCDGCSSTCVVEVCGNGILECAEVCDDGNTVSGDGCAADCTLDVPPDCGNGTLDVGEECDDGNTISGDGCQANCLLPACGDGILDAGEACDDGNTVGGDGCSGTCSIEAYTHTITIDGANDFDAAESFTSSTVGFTGYVAWDSSAVYIGFSGADVSANDAQRWLLVYLSGGGATTTTGVTYNTQGPTLPFAAGYHLRWSTDNLNIDLQYTDGTSWISMLGYNGAVALNGDFVELSIPLADIGSPTSLQVHLSMINEANMNEWSWAGVPDTSFVDVYDPDYTRYFDFDLLGSLPPGSYTPQP